MVNVKYWYPSVMNKRTVQSLITISAFVSRAMRGVGAGLVIATLSAGFASASSLDTLETFLKSTKSLQRTLQGFEQLLLRNGASLL